MILLQLFWMFAKLGLFSFGGGYAMVSIIQTELAKLGWMGAEEYANIVTISQMTPGPLAVNVATYVGAKVGFAGGAWMSVLGSAIATLGIALPSFILVILAAKLYEKIRHKKQTEWVMQGIRPAVIGLLANAGIFFLNLSILGAGRFCVSYSRLTLNFGALFIFLLIVVLNLKTKLGMIPLILLSAALGILAM